MSSRSDIHQRALSVLLQLLLGQKPDRADTNNAYDHVADCEICWAQFRQLADSLIGQTVEELQEVEVPSQHWLPSAPTFGEQYLLQHQAPDAIHQPGYWRRGNDYLARLTEGVEQATTALLVSFQRVFARPTPVLTHRSQDQTLDDRGSLEFVIHCNDLPDLEAIVTLRSDVLAPELVRPQVEISIPSRWPDFSGVRVTLNDGTQQVERTTGRAGYLEFDPIPRSRIPSTHFIVLPPKTHG